MSGATKRLLPAGLLAMILHGAVLFWHLRQEQVKPATPMSVQNVAVSLGTKKVSRQQPPEPKHVQFQKKKEVVPSVKPVSKIHKQSSMLEPTVIPDSKPRPVVRKTVHKRPRLQQKTEIAIPSPEPVASSARTNTENENAQATPASARVIQQASPLYQINPPPQYPPMARRRGLEGIVLLEVLVDISGGVANLKIFTSSGHHVLDRAALKAVRLWRFTPGAIAGKRHEMWVKVPVRFCVTGRNKSSQCGAA